MEAAAGISVFSSTTESDWLHQLQLKKLRWRSYSGRTGAAIESVLFFRLRHSGTVLGGRH